MRVSNQMIVGKFVQNIQRNAARMEKTMGHLSGGTTVNKPSDNPSSAGKILLIKQSMNQAEQYIKNVNSAESWFQAADTAFGNINDILQRVRELTVVGANGVWSDVERLAIATDIDQLREEMLQAANSHHEGKYIFATHDITVKPFNDDFTRNSNEPLATMGRNIEIAPNISLDVHNSGKTIFMDEANGKNVFDKLKEISQNILSGNTEAISANLKDIDDIAESFMEERVKIGVKTARLETTRYKYESEIVNLTGLLSKVNDVDIAEAMMNYKMQETVYQGALMSGSKIMQISLLDYMR